MIPRRGTINLGIWKAARLPRMLASPNLWNGELEVIPFIASRRAWIRTVLVHGSIARARYSTVRGVQLALDELGVRLMCDAVRALSDEAAL